MKHLPSQEEEAALLAAKEKEQQQQQQQQHPDSAYASPATQTSPSPFADKDQERKPRPESIIAPLPSKGISPLYASRITEQRHNREAGKDGTNESVRSLAPTGKSKGSTLKGVFQRKWSSGRKMFATKEIWNT